MANTKSAMKRAKQNEKRQLRNTIIKSKVRTAVRRFKESLKNGSDELRQQRLSEATSLLDRAATKGVIHKNQAARRKSRLMLTLQRVQAEAKEA